MFCTSCGARLEDGSVFCTSCGARIETVIEDTPAATSSATSSETSSDASTDAPADSVIVETSQVVEDVPESIPTEVGAPPATAAVEASTATVVFEPVTPDSASMPAAAPAMTTIDQLAGQPYAAQSYVADPYAAQAQPPAKKKSKKGLIIGIVAVVVVVAAVLSYIFLIGPALKANKEYDVQVIATGSATSSLSTTPLGLTITGTVKSDGSFFSQEYFVDGQDTIQLHEGSYTATVSAPVLASDGNLVEFSPLSIAFQVTESGASQNLTFTPAVMSVSDLTQALIDQAQGVAQKSGVGESTVNDYATKAKDKQKAEEAKKNAAEAEKKKAEEEAKAHTSGATWYVCASDFVTLRVSPSTSARAITRINSRQPVTYLGDAGSGWVRIRYDNKEGYVLSRFVSYDKNHPLDYGDV